jgi:hypothetical protein
MMPVAAEPVRSPLSSSSTKKREHTFCALTATAQTQAKKTLIIADSCAFLRRLSIFRCSPARDCIIDVLEHDVSVAASSNDMRGLPQRQHTKEICQRRHLANQPLHTL